MFKRLDAGEEVTVELPINAEVGKTIDAYGSSPNVLRAGLLLGDVIFAISQTMPAGTVINGLQSIKFQGGFDLDGPSPFVTLTVEDDSAGLHRPLHLGFRVLQSGEEISSGTAVVYPPERF